jgi:glutathione S-transferase
MATLYYWPIKARNVHAELIAAAGGIKLTREEPAWPQFKDQTHFGQLPFLRFESGAGVSQSGAIVRTLARRAGLEGKSEADFILSEMLTEEYGDLLNALGKAMYPAAGNATRPAAMTAFFDASGAGPKHLAHFEALVNAAGAFTSAPTSGELAVVAACHLLLLLEPTCLAAFPKLAAFYAKHVRAHVIRPAIFPRTHFLTILPDLPTSARRKSRPRLRSRG